MSNPTPIIRHEQFFNSLQELIDHTINADSVLPESSRSSREKTSDSGWTGTDSFETAINLAQFGWEEGRKKIQALTREITPKFAELFPRQDAGEELIHDLGGAYEDPVLADIGIDPADMINYKSKFDEIKQGNALQRLIIETGTSGGITPETYFIRGACVLALLESLENFGFRIEVILQSTTKAPASSYEKPEITVLRTVVKSFEEHSDYDKFAFCIANPAFERRLMFSCMEGFPVELLDYFGIGRLKGYGHPHNHPMYTDPARDFYMTRPLSNQSITECMLETTELINKRYKGFIQTVENPRLNEDESGGKTI